MWRSRDGGRGPEVTCIACGETVPRSDAREYDKYGDRWDRKGKEFEYLCKPCDRQRCHQPREGLEATLTEIESESGDPDPEDFLASYLERAETRNDSVGER